MTTENPQPKNKLSSILEDFWFSEKTGKGNVSMNQLLSESAKSLAFLITQKINAATTGYTYTTSIEDLNNLLYALQSVKDILDDLESNNQTEKTQ